MMIWRNSLFVISLFDCTSALPLAVEYMKSIQKENLSAVNEALNEIFVTEEDYASLRVSIDDFNNFDQIFLAQKGNRIHKHCMHIVCILQ